MPFVRRTPRSFLLSGLLLLLCLASLSQPARSDDPKSLTVGLFITNLFDLDFTKGDLRAQFWVWFNHKAPELELKEGVEIQNAKQTDQQAYQRQITESGLVWDAMKYDVLLAQHWKIRNYPFDLQTIRIVVESAELDARSLRFEPDVAGTKLSDELKLDGWNVKDVRIRSEVKTYATAYGDPALTEAGSSAYARVVVEIDIQREGLRLMLSNFIGFMLGIGLSGLALASVGTRWLSAAVPMGVRMDMSIGALFATVASAFVLQDALPFTTEFSLADRFQLTAFAATLLGILTILLAEVLRKARRAHHALILGRLALSGYVVAVLLLAWRVLGAIE